jgi:ssDNA-binding Zn-finger/Zn-ribbon topoisomerase 1
MKWTDPNVLKRVVRRERAAAAPKMVECPKCQGTGNYYRNDEDGDFLPCDCYVDYENFGFVSGSSVASNKHAKYQTNIPSTSKGT